MPARCASSHPLLSHPVKLNVHVERVDVLRVPFRASGHLPQTALARDVLRDDRHFRRSRAVTAVREDSERRNVVHYPSHGCCLRCVPGGSRNVVLCYMIGSRMQHFFSPRASH